MYSLTGVVRDATTSKGIANAEVEGIQGVNVGRGVKTDGDGAYRLDGLVAGSMQLRASEADYPAAQTVTVALTGNQAQDFQLAPLRPATYRYFGVVRDGVGAPVAGASITGSNCFSATTDASGRYDSTSTCSTLVMGVQPPTGFQGVLAYFAPTFQPGEHDFTTKRIVQVGLSAPAHVPVSDGTERFGIHVSATFDDGTNRTLKAEDYITITTTGSSIGVHGADGDDLEVEGLSPGSANLTAIFWGVSSAPVTVSCP
jgi:hypothetical protein